jgi:hypothetical protein
LRDALKGDEASDWIQAERELKQELTSTDVCMAGTVTILGAGATKSCGGSLTNEILHGMLQYKATPGTTEKLTKLEQFLTDVFRLPPAAAEEDYPG